MMEEISDSDPEEGLLSIPTAKDRETQTPQVLRDFREMFEGTQPSFMQDTQMGDDEGEEDGYMSTASSGVHIRSEDSGSDESGAHGDTDLGDSDSESNTYTTVHSESYLRSLRRKPGPNGGIHSPHHACSIPEPSDLPSKLSFETSQAGPPSPH